mmetsp:Transcript_29459/g.72929  ORF Transcript_29459/g.72929 Transcript_29459/m.72929 type:complete len:393 (+) Transcript_29459:1823-3001(+)
MLNLQTGVELEEEIFLALGVVQILNCASANIADALRQTLSRPLHLTKYFGVGNGGWALLKYLLEAALGGTVAAVKRNGVAMLVANYLHLEMPSLGAQLHHEHWRAWDLRLDQIEVNAQLVVVGAHADALATTALGCLQHDRIPDTVRRCKRFLYRGYHSLFEYLVRDSALRREVSYETITRPRDGRHLRSLRKDICTNLVTKHSHHRRSRADELDTTLFESGWEFRVLGRVAPPRPHRVDALTLGDVGDEVHVGVVVLVGATRYLDEVVSKANELGVGFQILRGGHRDELDCILVAEFVVCPPAHGDDRLGSSHAVVGDKHLTDHAFTTVSCDVASEGLGGGCVNGGVSRSRNSLRTDISGECRITQGPSTPRWTADGGRSRRMVADGLTVT